MYEFHPFYSNDGSIGLYSKDDDDIYHSAYGALSESWQKFIEPSILNELLENGCDVKILDICYGIGYNTKTALQFYINKLKLKSKFENNIFKKILKIFIKNFPQKKSKNNVDLQRDIAAIDTDNILHRENFIFGNSLQKNNNKMNRCTCAIDTDNLTGRNHNVNHNVNYNFNFNNNYNNSSNDKYFINEKQLSGNIPKLFIDAIDTNSILIKLSPFIENHIVGNLNFRKRDKNLKEDNDKLKQLHKLLNKKISKPNKEYTISDEINMLILKSLIDANHEIENNEKLEKIFKEKKFKQYLSKNMQNFARFYSNYRYKTNQNKNKLTFLHNIYYRYVSSSYKYVENLSNLSSISLNFFANDARRFILSSNNKYNLIFLDAFTPTKCPCLWTEEFFEQLYSHLNDNGMLLTYSNSAAVRNAFIKAGFSLGKIYDSIHDKFVGTIAVKNESLIKYPLDEKDFALINSKAGITYKDKFLNSNNDTIIKNRDTEFKNSNLISSTQSLKGLKNEKL